MSKQKTYHNSKVNASIRPLSSTKAFRTVGYTSLGLLGLVGLGLICPVSTNSVDAASTARVTAEAEDILAVGISGNVDISITPSKDGQFGYNSTALTVTTNNPDGYVVYLRTADGKTTLSPDVANGASINSITENTAGSAFTPNTWGYALLTDNTELNESSLYRPIPSDTTTPITSVDSHSGSTSDTYTLGFGVNINTALPAGEYSNSVVASIIANPKKITSLTNGMAMQDMTPEICQNTPSAYDAATGNIDRESDLYLNPIEKRLTDLRDGKQYYVAKLADGNCWMTQNLDYDLVAGQVLTSSDTDVTSAWVVPTSTEEGIPEQKPIDYLSVRSWDYGKVVTVNPTNETDCGYLQAGDSLADCPQYIDVSNMVEGFKSTETEAVSGNSYDAHYLVGNLYQWLTATAGSGTNTNAENVENGDAAFTDSSKLIDATSSICPAGWKLPTDGAYDQTIDGTQITYPYARDDGFYNLFAAYGYPETNLTESATQPSGWVPSYLQPYTATTGAPRIRLDYRPMYFARNNVLYPQYGNIGNVGRSGSYWSSTAYPGSTTEAYYVGFSYINLASTSHTYRVLGASIRCLAR